MLKDNSSSQLHHHGGGPINTSNLVGRTSNHQQENLKPCYYTFFSDDGNSPLQNLAATSKQSKFSSPNLGGSSSIPHFISKQEKDRLKLNSKKTVSLAFIGMGNENAMEITNQILRKAIFSDKRKDSLGTSHHQQSGSEGSSSFPQDHPKKHHQISIDSYHDVDQERVYLFADLMQKSEHCKTFVEQFLPSKISHASQTNNGYQNILQPNTNHAYDLEHYVDYERVLQTLLFLFQTCHMIFFILPTSQVNGSVCSNLHQNLLSLFRTLQISKQHINSKILDIHQEKAASSENPTMNMITTILGSGVMSSLYSPGRVLPVISFIFVQEKSQWDKMILEYQNRKENTFEDVGEYMINRMQTSIENQVRNHILKKGKFSGTDVIKTPLFMLDPQTCTFVIVNKEASESSSFSTKVSLDQARKALFSLSELSEIETKKTNKPASNKSKKQQDSQSESYVGVSKVVNFIQKQIDYFIKQMQAGKRFILPTSLNWYQATFAFEELFSLNNDDLQKVLVEKTKDIIHPNFFFSDKRCSHALKLATDNFAQKLPTTQTSNAKILELVNDSITKYNTFACGYFTQHYYQQLQTFLQSNTPKAITTQQSNLIPYQFYPNCPVSQMTVQKIGDFGSMSGRNGAFRRGNQIINFIQVHTMLSRDRYKRKKKKLAQDQDSEGNDTFLVAFEYETPRKDYVLSLDQLCQLYKQTYPQEAASALEMIQKTNIPLFLPSNWFLTEKKSSIARLKQITLGIPDVDLTSTFTFSPKIFVTPKPQDSTPGTSTATNPSNTQPKIYPLYHVKQGITFGRNQFVTIVLDYDSLQLNNYEDPTQILLQAGSIQIN
ncbi:hypothetical protein C9374_010291 [Naegleria lovaniensis]|uniref:Nonsense-mediated mRNA decay factor SMG8 n=1 Tax=Naegleria lovaniensis TaxID=51637 RepID=A0AA88KJH6_NAELO|nr:uncharacterized protein C9374_010291 [Naegleria lovaniensis]KAG2374917.1 hypothetical protein C9374_010291 [Naegleria lovaniensis]